MNRSRRLLLGSISLLLAVPSASVHADRAGAPRRALTRIENTRQDWTIRITRTYSSATDGAGAPIGRTISGATAWAPVIPSTATSDPHPRSIRGRVRIDGATFTDFSIGDGYQCGVSYAIWDVPQSTISGINYEVEIPVSSYETRIDERIANTRVWIDAPWSPMLASCLDPQHYIDPRDPSISGLVERWTKGQPRKAPPYYLAKYLAAKVIEHVQVSDERVTARGRGARQNYYRGRQGRDPSQWDERMHFAVQEASQTARSGKGSRYDLANLLCGVYRAAGLPARIVIGIDEPEQREATLPMVNAWVEFFLPFASTEDDGGAIESITEEDGEWIPVDIYRQKMFSSRPPPIDRPWTFFGSNQRSQTYAPFACHWAFPEADPSYGSLALTPVGVGTAPQIPFSNATMLVTVMGTTRRGGR